MRVQGIHHVSIKVDDVDAAIHFYVDVLGMKVREDRPDFDFEGAWLQAVGQQVHLIKGDLPTAEGQHFAVLVEDLPAAVEELRGIGLDVTDPVASARSLQSFVHDPSGNRVELHQPNALPAEAVAAQAG